MFGEILELWNLSDAAFYLLLIDIVRSEMDSPALHVRMRQTLRECIVPALMLLSGQKDAPKIILTKWFYFRGVITNAGNSIYAG